MINLQDQSLLQKQAELLIKHLTGSVDNNLIHPNGLLDVKERVQCFLPNKKQANNDAVKLKLVFHRVEVDKKKVEKGPAELKILSFDDQYRSGDDFNQQGFIPTLPPTATETQTTNQPVSRHPGHILRSSDVYTRPKRVPLSHVLGANCVLMMDPLFVVFDYIFTFLD